MRQITGTITCLASIIGIVFLTGSLIMEKLYNQMSIMLTWGLFMTVLFASLYYTLSSKFWLAAKKQVEKE
jgi:predicted MFS family arabinose efflux permease